jgi:hypothetical protein
MTLSIIMKEKLDFKHDLNMTLSMMMKEKLNFIKFFICIYSKIEFIKPLDDVKI